MMGRFMKGGRVAPFKPGDQEPDPDREILDNLRKRRWLLPPIESHYAPRRRQWRLLLLLFTCYEQIYIPLQLAFQLPRAGGELRMPLPQLIVQVCCASTTHSKNPHLSPLSHACLSRMRVCSGRSTCAFS